VQALAGEAIEYSKRNPAMDAVLRPYDLKPKAAAGIPTQPALTSPKN